MPIVDRFGDKLTTVIPGSEVNDPEKKPYSTQKTTIPAVSLMPIQPKQRMETTNANGICTLSGPILSATKFGTILPAIADALMIGSRYDESAGLVDVCSKAYS